MWKMNVQRMSYRHCALHKSCHHILGVVFWFYLYFVLAFVVRFLLGNVINSSFMFYWLEYWEWDILFTYQALLIPIYVLYLYRMCFVIACICWDIGIVTRNLMSSGLWVGNASFCKISTISEGISYPHMHRSSDWNITITMNPISHPKSGFTIWGLDTTFQNNLFSAISGKNHGESWSTHFKALCTFKWSKILTRIKERRKQRNSWRKEVVYA